MQEYAGSDLLNLETEIKKLKHFLGTDSRPVSEKDVLNVVVRVQPENIFALSKAIGNKNISSALISLARLLEDNQSEVGALSLISRHFRILARVREGFKKKLFRKHNMWQNRNPTFCFLRLCSVR